jgi:large subunit ribosomal protein L18
MSKKRDGRQKRKLRIRKKVAGTAERPRLTVFRSARHVYAQVIDDVAGRTVAHVSTLSAAFKQGEEKDGKKVEQAKRIGVLIAEACKAKNIEEVVFDRNGYKYHGRVQALAEGARKAGLKF